ncbi:hypothetical protein DIPPA_02253 [Diplonema papillatum]|nr:hypothetical protein DIPPA_02253 [Diplonema papillatum]
MWFFGLPAGVQADIIGWVEPPEWRPLWASCKAGAGLCRWAGRCIVTQWEREIVEKGGSIDESRRHETAKVAIAAFEEAQLRVLAQAKATVKKQDLVFARNMDRDVVADRVAFIVSGSDRWKDDWDKVRQLLFFRDFPQVLVLGGSLAASRVLRKDLRAHAAVPAAAAPGPSPPPAVIQVLRALLEAFSALRCSLLARDGGVDYDQYSLFRAKFSRPAGKEEEQIGV